MDCIKETENYLRYYRELHQSLRQADYMIVKLTWQGSPKGACAVSMDISGVRSSNPVNTLNQMYQIQKWQEMRDRTQDELNKIDELLELLCMAPGCAQYKDLLVKWYVDKANRENIAEDLGHSVRNLYRIKEQAIQKFSVMLFGIEALEAI